VYFGNWLRDYSQAVDVGTLQRVQAETIRVLVWILSFMSFGYATGEFEVTSERLGVYRPEEHIDNPKDYADNEDARKYDGRLRGPVTREELAVDPETGMKNYIANERGGWATSAGYVKFSFTRAIHYGRMYTHGPSGQRGRDEDLAEALRCLGQGLHCLEDFGAHTNYTELVLREMGHMNVFPHVGMQTQINLHGKHVFPLVTGTFGGVDFFHSVLGEATDHFTQSEVDQMNTALIDALPTGKKSGGPGGNGGSPCSLLTDALGKVPGTSGLVQEALSLQAASDAQAAANTGGQRGFDDYNTSRASGPGQGQPQNFAGPPGSVGGPPGPDIPGTNLDPATVIPRIYPILLFRDKVVRNISAIISRIPGLEKLIETITERVTLFVLSLLAPFMLPIINAVSKQLKEGSSAVIDSAGKHQYEVWTDATSTDPTHSMLSKDHFSNILNEPAGSVAASILQYVTPRVMYAMDHPDVPVEQVLGDVMRVFHHPGIRDQHNEIHRNMFDAVRTWAEGYRRHNLDDLLSSESVRSGRNHLGGQDHSHGAPGIGNFQSHSHSGGHAPSQAGGHQGGSSSGGIFGNINLSSGGGSGGSGGGLLGGLTSNLPGGLGNFLGGSSSGRTREADDSSFLPNPSDPYTQHSRPHTPLGDWSSFQPYDSAYHNASPNTQANQQPYQAPPEYNYGAPAPSGATWGAGQYTGGSGAEPAYAMPTAYQQGYEDWSGSGGYQGQQSQGQQNQGGWGTGTGAGAYGAYDQSQGGNQVQGHNQQPEGGGRRWGEGGGNVAW
jgi:hypothetical protein